MILTDELCDKLCAAAKKKAEKSVSILVLQSVMKTVCQGYIADMARRLC